MKIFIKPIICFFIGILLSFNYIWGNSNITIQKPQKIPRIRFAGDPFAQMATTVFTETLNDMLNKVEYGDNPDPKYPAGFFHTSTDPNGIPNYYHAMWTRDCGRGVIELCRLGFTEEAKMISRYFLSHKNYIDHWGRELHHSSSKIEGYELDGNNLIISAICNTWRVNGKDKKLGQEFCEGLKPVINWVDTSMVNSPYWGLMPSCSELSGNPGNPFLLAYSIFGNYGMFTALKQVADMAEFCGESELAAKAQSLHKKMEEALPHLISDNKISYAPEGCWFNAIDGRYGTALDLSAWGHTSWPIWHWTRQLPFIQDYDYKKTKIEGDFETVNQKSYELLRTWMIKGKFFRKYGFVSNTGWTGMDGRHDETMGGYGQGFFTQASLMVDDINIYGKCLEGIARLGYDGNVTAHESYDRNPFVMNECFNFENYEEGLDHTFGTHKGDRRELMENPGDEGNLVQEAEIIKAFSMVVGVTCTEKKLVFKPRLPWLWDEMECIDLPVTDDTGKIHRVNIKIKHERWLRKCTVEINGADDFDSIDIRFGPFPPILKNVKNYELETTGNGSWVWLRNLLPNKTKFIVEL